jgi:hypothetical protein
MNELFHDFIREDFVVVYLDDLLIFSKSHTQHLEHVRRVLERMRTVELFAKLIKCDFMTEELFYLGHIISKVGVKVDPRKILRVQEWPRPQTVKHIRQFLGLANYFRKYIKGYSTVAAPLTRLTGSTVAWEWGKEQDEAFQALKGALTSAPVLVLPDVQCVLWNANGTPRLRYWVRWSKFSPAFDSPEPLESFWPDAMDVVRDYHKAHKLGRIPWTTAHGVEASFDAPPEPVQSAPPPRKRRAGRRASPRAAKLLALIPTPDL